MQTMMSNRMLENCFFPMGASTPCLWVLIWRERERMKDSVGLAVLLGRDKGRKGEK